MKTHIQNCVILLFFHLDVCALIPLAIFGKRVKIVRLIQTYKNYI